MTGRPTIGTMGFGRVTVKGRRREPSPPAITTAFIAHTSSYLYDKPRLSSSVRRQCLS
jgi:hypothetical protein